MSDKPLISLAFNKRVSSYEDKIAYIAERIKQRFGDRVDAELPLSKRSSVAKLIYLKASTFDEAMKLADEIHAFLQENETVRYLNAANIRHITRGIDNDYARGWRGRFAEKFVFAGS
jgi:hypothetical protein